MHVGLGSALLCAPTLARVTSSRATLWKRRVLCLKCPAVEPTGVGRYLEVLKIVLKFLSFGMMSLGAMWRRLSLRSFVKKTGA